MSRTIKHEKPVGYDFWSRRCFGNMCLGCGPVAKWITKQKERTRKKRIVQQAINNPDNYEERFPGE